MFDKIKNYLEEIRSMEAPPADLEHGKDQVIDRLTAIIEAYLKLFKYELNAGISGAITVMVFFFIWALSISFVTLFLSLAAAWTISYWLDAEIWLGLVSIAGFYLLVFILALTFRFKLRKLLSGVIGSIIDGFLTDPNDEKE